MMTYLNMFSHHRLKSRIGSSDDLTPNDGDNRRAVASDDIEKLESASG